ncbi:MAG TPA: M14 family metallopeptidase, partial [Planctomycetota bacterium]|nr:M14 family metallopeptidase [Planctomycetota bacterium]
RNVTAIKISDNVGTDENEPEVLYMGDHHARELMSVEIPLMFAQYLLQHYGTDPVVTNYVNTREIYIIPIVNPDGLAYVQANHSGSSNNWWRKNRRNNGNGTFGVDLNRNYATGWNAPNGGNSTSGSSDVYRGTAPFSEPETAALDAFVAARHFTTVFTTHTYTDVLLWPWGWQLGGPANAAEYNLLGSNFVIENGVQQGPISNLLYIAAGNAVDHHHQVHSAYAFTAELGRSNEGGFWPTGQNIINIATRHQRMFRKIALSAGPLFDIQQVTVAEAPGGNGNGIVEPGEQGQVVVTVQNGGVVAGTVHLDLLALTSGPGIGLGSVNVPAARLAASSNAASPLTFSIPPGYAQPLAHLRVQLTGDGRTSTRDVDVPLAAVRVAADDDFELDRGWRRGSSDTATTGWWERAAPQQTLNLGTVIQPGVQTTPGGTYCMVTDGRAGTSASDFDVDGGFTDLLSPVMDLSHLGSCEASFDLWYTESAGNDAMTVSVSRDGGSGWTPLYSRTTSTGAWTRIALDLGAPLTAQMRLRVRAQDQLDSLVECLVDGLRLRGVAADGSVTLLSNGALGSSVRGGMTGPAGSLCFLLGSLAQTAGTTFPGVGGTLYLDPAFALVMPGVPADAAGHAATDVSIPNNPALTGATVYWQMASITPSAVAFGGNVTSVVLQ